MRKAALIGLLLMSFGAVASEGRDAKIYQPKNRSCQNGTG